MAPDATPAPNHRPGPIRVFRGPGPTPHRAARVRVGRRGPNLGVRYVHGCAAHEPHTRLPPWRRRRRPRPPLHGRPRQRDRAALAGALGRQRHVRGAEPGRAARRPRGRRRARPQAVRARHVPVPVGHRPARRAPAGLHRHRRLQPLPAHGRAQRAVHDGLRRLRAARRAVRRADRHAPGDHDCPERGDVPRADPSHRPEPRPPPLDRHHRPGLLPLDAVDLPADLRVVVRSRHSQPVGLARLRPPDQRAACRARCRHPNAGRRPRLVVAVAEPSRPP